MGKSRHVKHFQKCDLDEDDYHRNDKFMNRRLKRLKKLQERKEIDKDVEDVPEYS